MEDVVIPKHTVIQYVRDKNGNPRGVLVAVKTSKGFSCGYSLCNKKDRFSKNMALKIAIGRAELVMAPHEIRNMVPHEIRKMVPTFTERCKRYYKV